jgi:hypothetical protein
MIDYVSSAYFEQKDIKKLIIFYFAHESMEKSAIFFQYCQPTSPKPAQISNSIP